ncbi:MAG TPA: hypothetical protein IGS53_13790 [Leptolyngbyaceae cyanobacterium M33_DOE_097]|nr:hypothetical protein [Leptolyngbyaceae cyanobacterium M33_DOE_097]
MVVSLVARAIAAANFSTLGYFCGIGLDPTPTQTPAVPQTADLPNRDSD